METDPHIKELFTKYLNNSISREEYVVLLRYFGKEDDQGDLHRLVIESLSVDNSEFDNVKLGRVVDSVAFQLREKLQPRKTVRLRRYLPYVAASLLLISSVTAYYLSRTDQGYLKQNQSLATDVKPGHSAATLTLANGEKISLNKVSEGNITKESGITVSKTTNGAVIYTAGDSKINGNSNSGLNTLSTANGETYQIVLSDGTKVWLNAATTLQYSVNLRERGKRKVRLIAGEAYFEVAKDKNHPFVVESAKQEVEVLGTHFNINSYADEGKTVTTLAEGSVKVKLGPDEKYPRNDGVVLRPNQQSISSNGNIDVREADLQTALSWKEGRIYFKDAPIQDVLRQVSRWYNIEVAYEGEPSKEVFNGGIKRTANLSAVLRILELSNVRFSLKKKNHITVLTVLQEK